MAETLKFKKPNFNCADCTIQIILIECMIDYGYPLKTVTEGIVYFYKF